MTKKPKINLKIWIPIAAVVLIIIISLALLMSSRTRVAFLNIEEGNVEVDTGKGWASAQDGMDLSLDDKVRTLDGKAVVILYESVLVQLDENTEVSIDELSRKNVKIHQSSGSTWNKFAAIAGIQSFEVETPTTVATVRGTSFWVDMDTVGLSEGKLDVLMDGKKMSLTPNFKAVRDGTKVVPFDEADRAMAIARKQIIIKHLKLLRQQEIEKHGVIYNLIKKTRGYTDADIQRYMDRADRGELDVNDLRSKAVLPAKSVDKFIKISQEIKKQQTEMVQLKGETQGEIRQPVRKEPADMMDPKPEIPPDPYGKEEMPVDPIEGREMPPDPLDKTAIPPDPFGRTAMPPDPLN